MSRATEKPGWQSEERICPVDGVKFTPTRKWQKYCSGKCRWKGFEGAPAKTSSVGEPLPVLGIVLVVQGSAETVPCGFCWRPNRVDLARDGRQRATCACGARYFRRLNRRGQRIIGESWGWARNGKEVFFL